MPTDPTTLVLLLERLIATAPTFNDTDLTKQEWAGKAYAVVAEIDQDDARTIRLGTPYLLSRERSRFEGARRGIITVLLRSRAVAELRTPAGATAAFIAVAQPLDALVAVSQVAHRATRDILFVDPYMDEKALIEFAATANEGVGIRLLADEHSRKPGLLPATQRWRQQYGHLRPLDARVAPRGQLHDRVIVVDDGEAWILTQSFNALAVRAPAVIQRAAPEVESLKLDAYRSFWSAASPLM